MTTSPDSPAGEPGDVILDTITVTRSITPDGEYTYSYRATGSRALVDALGMLAWAQQAITYDAYNQDDPDD